MFLIIFSVISLVIAGILFGISQRFKYFSKQGIPGPKPKFFFGHTKESYLGKKNIIYEIDDVYRYSRGKYPFVGFYASLKPYFLVIDPELLKKILITDFKVFRNNDFSKMVSKRRDPILALNPFFMVDDFWKEKRAEVTPALTKNKLKLIYPIAIDTASKLIAHVDEKLTKPYDIKELCSRYTCDLISSSLFNVDAHCLTSDNPEIYDHSKKIMDGIIAAYSKSCPSQMFPKESAAFFKRLTFDAIRHRNEMSFKPDDLLNHIMMTQQKKIFSEDDLMGQVWTIFMDAYETAGLALQYTLYELARNHKAQDKLRDEIMKNLDDDGKHITYETIMELEYLNQVFYEALRLHSPITYTTRVCAENFEIDGAKGHKYQMKKGDVALIPFYSIHRDPDHYPHPESFEPERFDASNGGVKAFTDRCVLMPFGAGGRICIGVKLANVMIKTAVVEILKNYRISVDESVPYNLEIGVKEFLNVVTNTLLINFQRL
ncbi:probable cytochrome P450 28d1 [Chironomus tepperi]|uniref:probable cytochrome P450 28d1 n=1 Tax=Chironomus tepperi TaxID=113505 RepID=UPI00391F68D2